MEKYERKPEEALNELVNTLQEINERKRAKAIGKTKTINSLPESEKESLKKALYETTEGVVKLFGIDDEKAARLREIIDNSEISSGSDYAHFDRKLKVLRLGLGLLERYKNIEDLKPILAEEITHAARYLVRGEDENYSSRGEEFLAHISKLYFGYHKKDAQNLMADYKKQREGLWYSPEKLREASDSIISSLEEISEIGKIEEEELKKIFSDIYKKIDELRDNIPISARKVFDDRMGYFNSNLRYAMKYQKHNMKDEFKEIIEDAKGWLKDSILEIEEYLKRTRPYKKKTALRMLDISDDYGEYENLREHAIGYSSAERVFDYVQSGKINPKELFLKSDKELNSYLVDRGEKYRDASRRTLLRLRMMLIIASIVIIPLVVHSFLNSGGIFAKYFSGYFVKTDAFRISISIIILIIVFIILFLLVKPRKK